MNIDFAEENRAWFAERQRAWVEAFVHYQRLRAESDVIPLAADVLDALADDIRSLGCRDGA